MGSSSSNCNNFLGEPFAQPGGNNEPLRMVANDFSSQLDGESWLEVSRKGRRLETQKVGSLHGEKSLYSTFITSAFQGVIRSMVRMRGVKDSVTFEPFNCIQLEVAYPKIRNIIDALHRFFSPEQLSGLKKYSDSDRKEGEKTIFFESLPQVLVFSLKRFVYDTGTSAVQKLNKQIGYPMSLTIPKHFMAPKPRHTIQLPLNEKFRADENVNRETANMYDLDASANILDYSLYGVCLHRGSHADSGHYVSYTKSLDGNWLEFDDETVIKVKPKQVLNDSDAYLLFYSRNSSLITPLK